MKRLTAFYEGFCKFEEGIVSAFIAIITGMVFVAAVSRFLGFPLNWANDLALLLFAWVVFLGADVALRKVGFIRIDMLVSKFPKTIQIVLHYAFSAAAIVFLLMIVAFGTQLALANTRRLYQTLGISYSWATISAPVGALLLTITVVRRLVSNRKDALAELSGREAI